MKEMKEANKNIFAYLIVGVVIGVLIAPQSPVKGSEAERSGAGYGNRIRVCCLGSNYSATKLIPL